MTPSKARERQHVRSTLWMMNGVLWIVSPPLRLKRCATATQASRVHQDLQDPGVCVERKEGKDFWAQMVSLDPQVQEESQEIQVYLEKRVMWVHRGREAIQDFRV